MKKVILTFLISICTVTLIGCSGSNDSSASSKNDNRKDSSQVVENDSNDIKEDNGSVDDNGQSSNVDNSQSSNDDESTDNDGVNENSDVDQPDIEDSYSVYRYFSDDAIEVVENIEDKVKVHTRNGRVLKEFESFYASNDKSLYHDTVVVHDSDGIYIINNEKEIKIEQVYDAAISDNGVTVLYEYVDEDKNRFLKAYDLVTEETKTIDSVSEGYFYNLTISPDGKSFAYNIRKDDKTIEAFLSTNGNQPVSLGVGYSFVAISDEGKLVYYLDESNSFFVKKDNKTTTLSDVSSIKISFNKDYSQVMISGDDTNLSINGEEPIKLFESGEESTYIIDPEGAIYGSKEYCGVYGIDSFADKYFVIHYDTLKDVCYIDEKYTATKVLTGVSEYSISHSNEALVKADDCVYKIVKNEYEKVLDIPCRKIYATNHATNFYYTSEDDALYYKEGTKEPRLIASNILRYELERYKNVLYYIITDTDGRTKLHYTMNGEPGKIVKNGEDISMFDCSGGLMFYKYKADGYCDVYTNTSVDEVILMIVNFI